MRQTLFTSFFRFLSASVVVSIFGSEREQRISDMATPVIRSPEPCPCPITPIETSMFPHAFCNGGSTLMLFMTILESFVNGRCDLADPCRRLPNREDADDIYDFIVIGGGTAGSVVAGRLSANPQWKVLLIEAGGDEPVPTSVPHWVTSYWLRNDTDWNYYTEPQEKACGADGGKCYWPRAKMLGGTSAINGMMYMRGHPADYDGWAVNGAKGWSWSEVMPFFLMSEDNKEIGTVASHEHHNVGGPMPVRRFPYVPRIAHDIVAASIEMGYPPTTDLNGDNVTGFTIAQMFSNNGSRYTTSRGYIRPNSHRKNLHVVFRALVSRIVVEPALRKVTGVEYINRQGEKKVANVRKEVILSAGALNSPQILLLSGIGPKETLDKFNIPTMKDLRGVGQNLQNHVGVKIDFNLAKELDTKELTWATAMDYMLRREGPMSGTGMSQLTGMVNSKYAPAGGRHPDLQFFFYGYSADCSDGVQQVPEEKGRSLQISVINLMPKSRGYLTIKSVDPTVPPLMQPNYFFEERDFDILVEGTKIVYRLANTTIMREKYGMTPVSNPDGPCGDGGPEPSDEYIKCVAMHDTAPENHQVGTCKMGADDDPMAVVDTELRVFGIEGLRIADASVIPTVTTGNTAAPTVMVAERAADFIIRRYQRSKTDTEFGNRFGDGEPALPLPGDNGGQDGNSDGNSSNPSGDSNPLEGGNSDNPGGNTGDQSGNSGDQGGNSGNPGGTVGADQGSFGNFASEEYGPDSRDKWGFGSIDEKDDKLTTQPNKPYWNWKPTWEQKWQDWNKNKPSFPQNNDYYKSEPSQYYSSISSS